MTSRAILEPMKLKGTVKNGVIAVDLPEGTPVTVVVDEARSSARYQLDEHGELMMTPELEASIAAGDAEADRGEGIPWRDMIAELRRRR